MEDELGDIIEPIVKTLTAKFLDMIRGHLVKIFLRAIPNSLRGGRHSRVSR